MGQGFKQLFNQRFKQRLLGALVLVVLLVLLAPALFRGGDSHPLVTSTIEVPQTTETHTEPEFIKALDTPPEPVHIEEKDSWSTDDSQGSPGVDPEGYLKAWTLQLASFSEQVNAVKLRDTLRSKQHSAYIRKVIRGNGQPLYRVYIGPEVRTKELNELKAQLQKDMGLKGMVVRFQP